MCEWRGVWIFLLSGTLLDGVQGLSINRSTGLIQGTLLQPGAKPGQTRRAAFKALWLPVEGKAVGTFVLPEIPDGPGETVNNTPLWPGTVEMQ